MSTSSQPMRRVWERGVTDGTVGAGGTASDAPAVFPTYGKGNIVVHMNLPAGGGTLAISQYARGGTFPAAVPTLLSLAIAGTVDAIIPRTAELAGVTYTNLAVVQAPEIEVSVQ